MTLIVPACQPGWEEMENLRGKLRNFKRKLNFGQDSEARFGQDFDFMFSRDADVCLRFWS